MSDDAREQSVKAYFDGLAAKEMSRAIVFDELLQASEGAQVGFDADHLAVVSDGTRKSENFFSGSGSDIENDVARLGLVVSQEYRSRPHIHPLHVQPYVGVVIGEITLGSLMDPDTVVIEDPLHAVPSHDCS